MLKHTDISVIIPIYNSAITIKRALESVFAQTAQPKEIILVDDASTDSIKKILDPYKKKIILIRHKKNLGAAAARNTGIQTAKGSFIAFLDADDAWRPEKIFQHLHFIKKTKADASCSSFALHRNKKSSTYILKKSKDWKISILDGCTISPGSTLIVRREVFDVSGLFPTHLSRLEDWAWLIQMIYKEKKLSVCPNVLTDVYTTGFPPLNTIKKSIKALKLYIESKNILLTINQKRHFLAACAFELAAAYNRDKKRNLMFLSLTKALIFNPKLIMRLLPLKNKPLDRYVDDLLNKA